jgi:hypothetical protein
MSGDMNRMTILPGLRRLWRDTTVIQLGVDPAQALVIEVPDPSVGRLLDLLDGSRNERMLRRDASALGIDPHDVDSVLSALRESNVLVAAEALLPDSLTEPAPAAPASGGSGDRIGRTRRFEAPERCGSAAPASRSRGSRVGLAPPRRRDLGRTRRGRRWSGGRAHQRSGAPR